MLFQDLALWPNLTVTGNVRLGLSGLGLSRSESQKRIQHAFDLCGISDLAARRPGTLSGGQQQRVALARALAMQPQLLLLDEPLGGLDLITKQTVLKQIAQLKSQLGFAVVLVTHDPVEVRSLCNSLAVLEDGRIAEHGSLEELATNAQLELGKAIAKALKAHQHPPTANKKPARSASGKRRRQVLCNFRGTHWTRWTHHPFSQYMANRPWHGLAAVDYNVPGETMMAFQLFQDVTLLNDNILDY